MAPDEIYRLAWPPEYQFLVPAGPSATEQLSEFGTSQSRRVGPMRVERVERNLGRTLIETDFPWLSANAPAYSRAAVERLSDVLSAHGELLALDCGDDDYFVLDVEVRLDAVDLDRSKLRRFRSGRIMLIEEHAFHRGFVGDHLMFKLAGDDPAGDVFFSGDYVRLVERSGLVGAAFEFLGVSE